MDNNRSKVERRGNGQPNHEVLSFDEISKKARGETYAKKIIAQDVERYGTLPENDPRRQLLSRIQEKLYAILPDLPRGQARYLSSTEINAFVVKGLPDVFMYDGLLRQFLTWCEQNKQDPTEDAIAMVFAHELGHIRQGTEEIDLDESTDTEKTIDRDEIKKKHQQRMNDEYDADRFGLQLMARAGYNPREGLKMLNFLVSLDKDGIGIPTTHPRSQNRFQELVALVESSNTIIPNTDKAVTALPTDLIDTLQGEQPERPGTELYRRSAMDRFPELITSAQTIYDAMEVTQVALTHRYFEEVDRIRQSAEVRDAYAKEMFIENLNDIVATLRPFFMSFQKTGMLYFDDGLPKPATRYVNREYGYMQAVDELRSGRSIDTGIAQYFSHRIDRATDYLKEEIDRQIKDIEDKKLTIQQPTGKDISGMFIHYKQQLLDIKDKLEDAVRKIDASALDKLTANVDKKVYYGQELFHTPLASELVNASGEELLDYCAQSGSPVFYRLIHPNTDRVKVALGNTVAADSRYKPYLDTKITGHPDLRMGEGRREFIEQSIFQQITNLLNDKNIGMDHKTIVEPLVNNMQPDLIKIQDALANRLAQRYSSLGENAETFARLVAANVLSLTYNFEQKNQLISFTDNLNATEAAAWLESVQELIGEFQNSARAVFLEESGMSAQLVGTGHPNLQAALFTIEAECRSILRRKVPEAETANMAQLITQLTLGADHMRRKYLETIMRQLEAQRDWGTATEQELDAAFTPVLQVLSEKERYNLLFQVISTGQMPSATGRFGEALPNILELMHFLVKACPQYARHLLSRRLEKQLLTLEPELKRLEFLQFLYQHADVFTDLREKNYGDPKDKPDSKIGLEYVRLRESLNSEEGFVDAIVALTKGNFLNNGVEYPVFGDHALQARILALPEHDMLRIATAATESSVQLARYSEFVDILTVRVLSMKGVSVNLPLYSKDNKPKFEIGTYSFDDVFRHIATYVVKKHREYFLLQCQEAYDIDNTTLVADGYAADLKPINPSVMISGKEKYQNFQSDLQYYADSYSDSDMPFHETHLRRDVLRAEAVEDYLSDNPIYKDRGKTIGARLQAIVELIPEETDFRDAQLAKIESDRLAELQLTPEGHILVTNGTSPDPEKWEELYQWYEQAIPICAGRVQAELWGRRAHVIYERHIVDEQQHLQSELNRIQRLFPSASFARDEALLKLGNSALVKTPDDARAVQNLTTDLSRRSTKSEDINNQSQLEKINVLLGTLSRTEKKDFLLWMLGAQDQPPMSLKAYGGYYEVSFKDLPAVIFAATAPEREQLFLRLLCGSNGLLEPQTKDDHQTLAKFTDAAFAKIFPDNAVTGITGQARKILSTAFTTVFQKYNSYRGTQIFTGMIETMRGDQDAQRGKRIVSLLSELGPVFVKVGQVLSETEESPGVPLLPEDIRTAMRGLKQDAKQFSRLAAVFSLETANEFALDNPKRIIAVGETLAAASIKQVSNAEREDGKQVVEKVLRPSVEKHLREDARVLNEIVRKIRDFANVPRNLEESAASYVREEANFEREVENAKKIEEALRKYNGRGVIRIMNTRTPEIYTYSERHIQEEKIKGISLDELMRIHRDPSQLDAIAIKHKLSEGERDHYKKLAQDPSAVYLQAFDAMAFQYFQADAFHGDPHSGNILLPVEGGLAFIDNGSIGDSNETSRKQLQQFFLGFTLGRVADLRTAVEAFAPGIKPAQLDEVAKIATSKANNADKMKQILKVVTNATNSLHPTFDKFLKSFSTGAHLMNNIHPFDLKIIVGAYTTQGERGLNTSLIVEGVARTILTMGNSNIGKMLKQMFGDPKK